MNARAYLLGQLSADARKAAERWLLEADDALEVLGAAEDELIEEYLTGRLDPQERALFQRRFLADPVQRERVHQAAALARAAHPGRRSGITFAAVAAVGAALLGILLFPGGAPPNVVEVTLAAPTRADSVAEVVVGDGATTVRLRLELPAGASAATVQLSCRRLGGGVIQGHRRGAAWEVAAEALPSGRYELSASVGGVTLAYYRFHVARD